MTIWPTEHRARGSECAVLDPPPNKAVRVGPYLLFVDAREPSQVLLVVGAWVFGDLEMERRVDDEPKARRPCAAGLVDDEGRQQGGPRAASDAHCPGREGDLDAGYRESVNGLCPASVGQDDQRLVPLEGLDMGAQVQARLDVSAHLVPALVRAQTRKVQPAGEPLGSCETTPRVRVGIRVGPPGTREDAHQKSTASTRAQDRLDHAPVTEVRRDEDRSPAAGERLVEVLKPLGSDRLDAGEVVDLRPDPRKVAFPKSPQVAARYTSQLSPAGRRAEVRLERLHEPSPKSNGEPVQRTLRDCETKMKRDRGIRIRGLLQERERNPSFRLETAAHNQHALAQSRLDLLYQLIVRPHAPFPPWPCRHSGGSLTLLSPAEVAEAHTVCGSHVLRFRGITETMEDDGTDSGLRQDDERALIDALAAIGTTQCSVPVCDRRAVGIVQQQDGTLFPACERHAAKASALAFRVIRPTDDPSALEQNDLTIPRVGVGDPAPDVELPRLDGEQGSGEAVRIASVACGRPIALAFGSYSVPKFRKYLADLEDLYQRFSERVCFFLVYTREVRFENGTGIAHRRFGAPPDGPESPASRAARARKLVRDFGLSMPVLVDGLDDEVTRVFGGYPLRLYLVGKDGRIVYQGAHGPYAFQPSELEDAIRQELG